ncbi:MAG: hypothetical protein A3F54_01645 [Candidatus Kerfeldbacteria bacterium RIFCSPHIGHO2_12_FULL_48_17]|uniref:Uncharacterized protein n=1 Tax=Candidatus Kerfeldbacteria bacterium RIFCSPHIGHO2_12_FULL_48_17 TaxID=1798542 RepID=A0A1G2B1Q0_9BACT|nr:MAG: hypothetical protein A3F54_01645 [Candidatus Kerfeldbacteria bacterium RIFCSPHIGHO2_12_FULL_48_17]
MKFLYVTQGFGEFAQAEALAFYAKNRSVENIFICDDPALIRAIRQSGFPAYRSTTTHATHQLIRKIKPDVLLLCNSKTVFMHNESILKEPPPRPRPLITCLDSNWLFLRDKRSRFPVPDFLDVIFVVMPRTIYRKGLRKYGGHYQISPAFAPKIYAPGFIPSGFTPTTQQKRETRARLGLRRGDKLIFSYFGVREPSIAKNYVHALATIMNRYQKKGRKVKVFLKRNGKSPLPRHDWLIEKHGWVQWDEYVRLLAAADLVIQHHGLGTLPKVIRNQVPTLCIVPHADLRAPFYEHSPAFEIDVFERLGLCSSLPYNFSAEDLEQKMTELLYQPQKIQAMKAAQAKHFAAGEKAAFDYLMKKRES